MKLCPVPLFFYYDIDLAKHYARLSSKITHAHPECLESADMMGEIIVKMLTANSKEFQIDPMQYTEEKVRSIARGDYKTKTRDQIFTTGYVIHTLEAALLAFHKFDTFEEGVLHIYTMGSDTDSVASVFSQVAGAYYGFHAIPKRWINQLQQSKMIMSVLKPFVDLVLK
jgi:ADP-ribosyl-[dinitrogen reductase] hydrolase